MSITDRAQKALTEIDAALALAEKAAPGPWSQYFKYFVHGEHSKWVAETAHNTTANATFIAASRTGWPATLRCLKTAIEGLLTVVQNDADALKAMGLGLTADDLDSARVPKDALAAALDQWEAGR